MRRLLFLALLLALLPVAAPAWADCTPPQYRTDLAPKWKDGAGNLVWPPNDGAAGTPAPVALLPGMLLDRYGCEWGNFLSPRGASFSARALPYVCETSPYFSYRVLKPVVVWTSKAAPWFDQKGGATQFQTDASVAALLADGVLEKVAAQAPACGK